MELGPWICDSCEPQATTTGDAPPARQGRKIAEGMHYQRGCTQAALGSRSMPDVHCYRPHARAVRELLTMRRSRGPSQATSNQARRSSVGQLRRAPAAGAYKPFTREYALDMLDTSTIYTSMLFWSLERRPIHVARVHQCCIRLRPTPASLSHSPVSRIKVTCRHVQLEWVHAPSAVDKSSIAIDTLPSSNTSSPSSSPTTSLCFSPSHHCSLFISPFPIYRSRCARLPPS